VKTSQYCHRFDFTDLLTRIVVSLTVMCRLELVSSIAVRRGRFEKWYWKSSSRHNGPVQAEKINGPCQPGLEIKLITRFGLKSEWAGPNNSGPCTDEYKLGVLMYRCQHNKATPYLMDHCSPVSDVVFRQRLRSASSHQLSVLHYRLSTYGRRAFSVAGPTVWNSLPEDLRDLECCADSCRQSLKTFLFSQY